MSHDMRPNVWQQCDLLQSAEHGQLRVGAECHIPCQYSRLWKIEGWET